MTEVMEPMRGQRRLAPAALSLAMVVVLVGLAGPTATLAKCQPGRTNNGSAYWAGWYRNTSSGYWGGIFSDIYNYSPWVQPGTDTTAWVMLTKKTGGTNWAQVGWWEEAYGVRHTFTQYTDSSGHWYTTFWSPKATNTYTYYTTLWNNTPGKFTFQVAGSTVQTVTAAFSPDASQIMGEIHSLASQMPGGSGSSYHEWFTDSHVWTTSWIAYDGTSTGNQTYWTSVKSSSTADYTYDKACSS